MRISWFRKSWRRVLFHLLYFTKALLGENRQRYLERLKERLERRQKRIEEGLDPDEEDEETMRLLEEEQADSTGNILRDLQNRFDEEKDALLRRLQVEFGLFVLGINPLSPNIHIQILHTDIHTFF